jgi:membrane dipeptidase
VERSGSSTDAPSEPYVVIDGLQVSAWSRDVFVDMHRGRLAGVNCTVCVWENFTQTMINIGRFQRFFHDHADLITPASSVDDILGAHAHGRVGIILGLQNASAIEDNMDYLYALYRAGVRIIQLAYNTQNLVGGGCYERDGGLSSFGADVVREMNRLGIVIDLSHVGSKTSREAIEQSTRPVTYSHTAPAALHAHARNKSDDELRFIAERGGLIGVTPFPWFLRGGRSATVDDYLTAIEHTIDVAGEEHVGIGTDFVTGHSDAFFEWILQDKGYGRPVTTTPIDDHLPVTLPEGLSRARDFADLPERMRRRGWKHDRIARVLGDNWLRLLRDVW